MPEPSYIIRQGDHGVTIDDTLTDEDGVVANLTGATVVFNIAPIGGGSASSLSPVTSGGTTGTVSYEFGTADTDTAGTYKAEWEVTYGGGEVQTFPNGSYIVVRVVEAVN